jgi:hypothetical protein
MLCRQGEFVDSEKKGHTSRRAMASGGGISLLGEALRAALARLPASTGLVHYPIWAEWSATVGPTIAAHARPAQLRQLNARLGSTVVRDVYLVLATG